MLSRKRYAAAPAMAMAFGIFINFALRFLLERTAGGLSAPILQVLSYLLVFLALHVFVTIYRTFRQDRPAIWQLDSAHFAIGVWPAALNVAAAAVATNTPLPWLSRALNLAAWACWALYMYWFLRLLRARPDFGKTVQGSAFLLTVSTQSTIVGTLSAWGAIAGLSWFFLAFNLLGLLFYLYVFVLVWVLRGPKAQLAEWRPANNITHGALSISILALEIISVRYAAASAAGVLNGLWICATAFLLAILAIELILVLSPGSSGITRFDYGNYARNFTFGMYFACTWYGLRNIEGFLARRVFSDGLFLALALVVMVLNLWEGIRHAVLFFREAGK
jgi:hypothetical protein